MTSDGGQVTSEVHLWWSTLNQPESVGDVLSADEQARAARFHFARDRRRFILARGMLRHILAQYVDRQPQEIKFQYSLHGKPRVADPPTDLEFNLTHSEELVLCAITRGRPVGVDVEHLRPMPDLAQVAASSFSLVEQIALFALKPDERLRGFFNCWTRKEAYVKARGNGLRMPLNAFDVSLKPGEPAALLANRLDPAEVMRWSLAEVSPAEEYVGAVAVQGQGVRVELHRWEPGEDVPVREPFDGLRATSTPIFANGKEKN
jgi:4'-phosphopantetheinyl transferase